MANTLPGVPESGWVDSAAGHVAERQQQDEGPLALGPGLRCLPDVEHPQRSLVEQSSVAEHENAPSGLQDLINVVDLERDGMGRDVACRLGARTGAEGQSVADPE